MNQEQRDRLIDRYMSRQMSLSEEGELMRLVESDETLRRMLETERAVHTTLLRDRDALPVADREARTHLLSILGALPADAVPAASGSTGFLTGGVLKGIIGVLVAGAITAGYVLVGNDSRSSDAAPAVHRSIAQPSVISSSDSIASPPAAETDREVPAEASAKRSRADAPKPAGPAIAGTPAAPSHEPSHPEPAAQPTAEVPAEEPSAPSVTDAAPERNQRSESALRTRDTMRVNVSINMDRLGKRPR
jgi:hypothetical protein